MNRFVVVSLVFSLVLLPAVAAGLERFPVISTQELEQLLARRQAGEKDFMLINTLDRIIANDATIPGSINIPVHTMRTSQDLPADHTKLLVFY
jgi:3-mercaptopyruvate sulfurtransferase SseA